MQKANNKKESNSLSITSGTNLGIYVRYYNIFHIQVFLMIQCLTVCTAHVSQHYTSWNSLLVEHQTRDRKVASSNPSRSGRKLSSPESTFCAGSYWSLFSVCSTPLLLRWHIKGPGHSVKSAGGRLDLNMLTPLIQLSQNGLTMPLSRHNEGTYQSTNSHSIHLRTLGHSCLSS